jgi:hypothetical protein
MSQLPPRIRWTGSPIEVAIALGLLGPAWMESDDDTVTQQIDTVTNRTQNKLRPQSHRRGAP